MFTKILVPLDGSQLAELALAPAFAVAKHSAAQTFLLRVPVPDFQHVGAIDDLGGIEGYLKQGAVRANQEAKAYLEEHKQASSQTNLQLHVLVKTGQAAEMIVDTARAEAIDLIVMSSHGRTGISRWVYGSIAERVLRHAPCPVLVIRSPAPLCRMLIPLDGSVLSESVLKPGFEIAAALGCEVTLLQAIHTLSEPEMNTLNKTRAGAAVSYQESLHLEAQSYLKSAAAAHTGSGITVHTAVRPEPAADSILDYAEENGNNLIAMATHGRSGLQRWIFGSVTEKVLHGAHASMFIVRPAMN